MTEFAPAAAAIAGYLDVSSIVRVYTEPIDEAPQDVPAAIMLGAAVVGVARGNGYRTTLYSQTTRVLVTRGESLAEASAVLNTLRDELLAAFDPDATATLGLGNGWIVTDQRIDEPSGISYPAGDPAAKFVGFDHVLEITHTKPM